MKLPFSFNNKETTFPWPSCGSPKTLSFRANNTTIELIDTPIDSISFSSTSGDAIDTMVRGLWSERLFFEPGESSSILEEAKKDGLVLKESGTLVMAMESEDPYVDFKRSMEEMVEAHDWLRDWECLEELLSWYLRFNEEDNHGFIVKAYVDLLVGLANSSSYLSSEDSSYNSIYITHSPTSPLSFSCSTSTSSTSPCLSSLEEVEDEIEKMVDINGSSSS